MTESDPKRVAVGRLVEYLLRAGWKPPPLQEIVVERIMDDMERVKSLRSLAEHGGSGMLLTPMQVKVLQLVAEGRKNEEIAEDLGRSVATVKFHLDEVYRRLDARTRAHAVAIAISLDEISGLDIRIPP